ncbi:MAG: Kae1-associated serine/threonine protein kinase [Candidatus Diapherotrites archaeon]|nr:Kae1-associated serine/threonine protein kinase [Candidatus Diapherotrites archaeon]
MNLIKHGAEAKLFKAELFGKTVLIKKRIPKKYRNPELEKRIVKSRIKKEITLLKKMREAGIKTPIVFNVNLSEQEISMEFIKGKTMKTHLDKKHKTEMLSKIGKCIGLMHSNNLIHGDLTTNNILIEGKNPVFIDFGLGFESNKIEDKAVDLVGFKKTFTATHTEIPSGWNKILEGYRKGNHYAEQVIEQIKEVEKRIRYA